MSQVFGDRWEVIHSLREGGQAHTFLVRDRKGEGEQHYVLKRLKNRNRIERFKREIEAVRNLSHENIVRLIDFDLDATKPYLVSEYCAGGSLADAEPFWRTTPAQAFAIFQEVCAGIAHAHDQGIIHRDIKPDNVFLRTPHGPAVVGDFGICYLEADDHRLTNTQEAVGPRLFMAPELEDGRADAISPKSDTYALGKLLYWLLSGRIFSREKHREQQWDLKGYNEDTLLGWNNVSMEHVNRLLDRMIVRDPAERRTVRNVSIYVRDVARLVEKEYNPVSMNIRQRCLYCGSGFYVLRAHKTVEIRNFGYSPVGDAEWRIFTCNMCGHVQTFRIEQAHHKDDWWG